MYMIGHEEEKRPGNNKFNIISKSHLKGEGRIRCLTRHQQIKMQSAYLHFKVLQGL